MGRTFAVGLALGLGAPVQGLAAVDLDAAARAFPGAGAAPPAAVERQVPAVGGLKELAGGSEGFYLEYLEPTRKRQVKWAKLLRESAILDSAVERLNARFIIPARITVEVADCGEANAWYDADERKITFCYELLGDSARRIEPLVSPRRDAPKVALGDAVHALYHEVGHALIHVLKLPAVGREEDAADQFATLELLDRGGPGVAAAQVAALEFKLAAREAGPKFWDEHSFDRQRSYDILCLIYGKDPESYAELVGSRRLPEARAERCADEYAQIKASWASLLEPHRK